MFMGMGVCLILLKKKDFEKEKVIFLNKIIII